MKLHLPSVTLICADTTSKSNLAEKAILKCLELATFGSVKLLTDNASLKHSVKIEPLKGLESYSNFCVRDMTRYVDTSHALVCQADGYILKAEAWTDDFLKYDYVGAPWLPSGTVGNGGFSLRSKKLLNLLANTSFPDSPHPEDNYICLRHRPYLEKLGIKFAPPKLAERFAFEGRSWNNGLEWQGVPEKWDGQFGFHSWLTPIPKDIARPKIFHHSGDSGDTIYSLATIAALGGGVLFMSADNRYPYPRATREAVTTEWVNNLAPLLEQQDYIWKASFTHGLPFSVDYDLNKFRSSWKDKATADFDSIFKLHLKTFETNWPEDKPWLKVDEPIKIKDRPIVVARSERFHNEGFPWHQLILKYGGQMVIVGTELEASAFNGIGAPKIKIPYYQTKNMLELARVIAGAKVCIMNQSAPLAIAHGLCKNVIVEEWQGNSNCRLRVGKNTIHYKYGNLEIPSVWFL